MEGSEEIKTFIFFDLETSGLPRDNPVKITEISLVAAQREHILDIHSGISKENSYNLEFLPRVLNKVSFTLYPSKLIHPMASAVSGKTFVSKVLFQSGSVQCFTVATILACIHCLRLCLCRYLM